MDDIFRIFIIFSVIHLFVNVFVCGIRSIKYKGIKRFDNIYETIESIIILVTIIKLTEYYLSNIL